ncbi:hypothetical protein [Streptomyces huiliensis]|uniref:hypothetical protein n=1 Tax=Streptomyces huiliensis TaxID=2876027 RepID=UPI001CBF03F6|nr:hypothetical protein [Streptomyces huiliensis]MBZ4320582.1 hypothetical protein [Streptomyces huiliensis]
MTTSPADAPSTPQDAPGRGRRKRRRILLAVGAPVALLAAAAGAFFAFGGYERLEDSRSMKQACQGALSKKDLSAFLDRDRLHAEKRTDAARGLGWVDRCVVLPRGGKTGVVDVDIGWADKTRDVLSRLGRPGPAAFAFTAVPIGNGWSGAVLPNAANTDATVLLPCRGTDRTLMVNVTGFRLNSDTEVFRDPKALGTLARLTTGTAERAARKLGCEAAPGAPVKTLSPPPLGDEGAIPLNQAAGTCRALKPAADAFAVSGGHTVEETAADDGPVEDCIVSDRRGGRLYRLGAFYGPYAREVLAQQKTASLSGTDGRSIGSWATAECRGFFGQAGFTLTSERGSHASARTPAVRRAQQAMLAAFARDAVRRHGCSDLTLPRADTD